jgi:hypothetical protein
MHGKTDALEQEIDIHLDSAEPLEILLKRDGGRIDGAVADAAGRPPARAEVVLVPDPARRRRTDLYKVVVSGDDGSFAIRGIAPGDYKVFAWESVEPNAYLNDEFMRQYEERGIPVRVTPGVNPRVQGRLILGEP